MNIALPIYTKGKLATWSFSVFGAVGFLLALSASSQSIDSLKTKKWAMAAFGMAIFQPDNLILLPIVYANKNKLHLEGRYNYEGSNTASVWAGCNFSGGRKLTYILTPMIGAVVGKYDGLAPGLEADLRLGRLGFYTEMECLLEFNDFNNSYFYNWSKLAYSLTRWMSVGLAVGRNRIYKTEVDIQRGCLLGFTFGRCSLTGYYYNPFTSDQYGSLGLFVAF